MTHEELLQAHQAFRTKIQEAIKKLDDYEDECDGVWSLLRWWDVQKEKNVNLFLVVPRRISTKTNPNVPQHKYSDMRPVPSDEGIVPDLVLCLNDKTQRWELFSPTHHQFIPCPATDQTTKGS